METHCSTLYKQTDHSPNRQWYPWLIDMEYQERCVIRRQYLMQIKNKWISVINKVRHFIPYDCYHATMIDMLAGPFQIQTR